MNSNVTTTTEAHQMLDSLYAVGAQFDADWSGVGDETLAGLREAAASGDEALQKLLTNLAFTKFEGADQAARLSASLAGIKQAAVAEIFEELPTTSIEDLRVAAEAAGYEVEILA
ncbi:hypothetical protein [Streptomyces gobiensis]|uniref:hypothetical protein n=1 Tax=Streptomyces gobiensis TaxID=2875706 RepID=UPI001E621ADE|nr:hypothetical protein [Streptomyces gobiensis]UGY92399.1 hypothetical protein test1122_12160 [Streptomyces gobiensis]